MLTAWNLLDGEMLAPSNAFCINLYDKISLFVNMCRHTDMNNRIIYYIILPPHTDLVNLYYKFIYHSQTGSNALLKNLQNGNFSRVQMLFFAWSTLIYRTVALRVFGNHDSWTSLKVVEMHTAIYSNQVPISNEDMLRMLIPVVVHLKIFGIFKIQILGKDSI